MGSHTKRKATMLFNFRLRPMRDIPPWGPSPHPGWFGLSDGWYWIDVGEATLFRYSQALLDRWAREHRGEPWLTRMEGQPYVDYQVARLWQDVLDLLPDVVELVPPWLARALCADGVWMEWQRQAEQRVAQSLPEREAGDLLYAATRWMRKRTLDSAYLVAGPDVWFWSDGVDVHIRWDNREQSIGGIPAWEAVLGQHIVPMSAFLDEVHAFDERFLRRMWDRVAIAQAEWSRPDVELDPHLAEAQLASVRWSKKCCEAGAPREPTDWDDVARAIARIEALPGFAPMAAVRLL